jgi:hypothetical protein
MREKVGPSLDQLVSMLEDRDRALEDYLNGLTAATGSGHRYATVVVAASNSLSHAAADADFVCTGTNDNVTLQAAINKAGTSAAFGGRVLLLDGDYYLAANSQVQDTYALSELIGQSAQTTNIHIVARTSNASSVNGGALDSFIRVAHLSINMDAIQTFDTFSLTRVPIIEDVMFFGYNRAMTAASYGAVGLNAGGEGRIYGCGFVNWAGNGISVPNSGLVIMANQLSCTGIGLDITASSQMVFGNQILGGAPAVKIDGASATDVSVIANVIRANSGAADIMTVDGARANVQLNKLLPSGVLATNGIRVVATSTDAFVTNNDLKGCATNPFVNAGVGTITVAGNRT